MLFTSDSGERWESTEIGHKINSSSEMLLIRPIQEPKWSVGMSKNLKGDRQWHIDINSGTEILDQAQLIKQKIEKLMMEHFDE